MEPSLPVHMHTHSRHVFLQMLSFRPYRRCHDETNNHVTRASTGAEEENNDCILLFLSRSRGLRPNGECTTRGTLKWLNLRRKPNLGLKTKNAGKAPLGSEARYMSARLGVAGGIYG